jgi:hypothetical protein
MKNKIFTTLKVTALVLITISLVISAHVGNVKAQTDVSPPASPVKLVFIHHSTGGNWLANTGLHESAGGLGKVLMDNNYFVSATNYGWGPDGIGDRTDIPNWPEWFTGANSATIMNAVYNENNQNVGDWGDWSRLSTNLGGENEIVMFKSCFPNSDLYGNPTDPPATEVNDQYTVANAKTVYNNLLTYFQSRQDKLFIVVTAPPLMASSTTPERAANARAFNNWLVNDWLSGYAYKNVAVFDFYNVLTGENNHHRWANGQIEHVIPAGSSNYAFYPSGDDHPNAAGGQKASTEFVPLLNLFYHRWKDGETSPTATNTPILGETATTTPNATPSIPTATKPAITATPTLVYLPVILKNSGTGTIPTSSAKTPTPTTTSGTPVSALIQPADLVYQGSFRLPDDGERPNTFAYGGNAMTFNPNGDTTGASDGYPGSLFITGHDRMPYGDLPNGSQVAEVNIPKPVKSTNVNDLSVATFGQAFQDVAKGFFTELSEIPRIGLAYLDTPATGPKIHIAWGQHLQPENVASHGWFDPNLASSNMQGTWFIGNQPLDSVNGYMFTIPKEWADQYAGGRYLATGRMRDGGQAGMGPTLFAYRPWTDSGAAPPTGTHLQETVLLLYENSRNSENIEHSLKDYQHPDEWEGGDWLTTSSGKTAVLFAGTKSKGTKYWYGFLNPKGADYPCIEVEYVNQYTTCRLADGTPCPAEDLTGCEGHVSERGWWSTQFAAQFILYNPTDLGRVADGQMKSWEPQPYTTVDIEPYLFHNPTGVDPDSLGTGNQRRYRIGSVAYDRTNGILYVLELFADEAKPVVHVWKIN